MPDDPVVETGTPANGVVRPRVLPVDRDEVAVLGKGRNGVVPLVTNQFAGSDGDIFPAAVQIEKLAPVIGMRSWGGVIGIYGLRPLVDMGLLTEPEGSWNDPKRGWTLENHGVDPDIVVENPPAEVAKGVDAQLDRAIAEVMKLVAQHPPAMPKLDPVRNRSRIAFGKELGR